MDRVMYYLWRWLPELLTVAAAAVLWIGWPRALRYGRPHRWRAGVVLLAIGLVSLWIVPIVVRQLVGEDPGLGLLQFLAIALVSPVLISAGVQLMMRSNDTVEQDFWRSILY